ncbi:MAG: hypothetical protein ACLUEQ_01305 [Cloacibacillus evryensis]
MKFVLITILGGIGTFWGRSSEPWSSYPCRIHAGLSLAPRRGIDLIIFGVIIIML